MNTRVVAAVMAALLVGALSLPAFAQDKPRQGGELIFRHVLAAGRSFWQHEVTHLRRAVPDADLDVIS